MATKPVDPAFNAEFLADLADHAHKLVDEFLALPAGERERATELISEVQHILSEFRRLRPPPTFAKRRLLRLVKAEEFCAICSGRVDRSMGNFTASEYAVYHTSCLDGPD
ncbi:MAG TPA: hypothetical protein VEY94_04255 [Patescibacteria group bacterium]|nr:hypothetical protein [Patescibacteria group bacterium]